MSEAKKKRRPKGEGSYWQQADGTWRGFVPLPGYTPAGNPKRKYFKAATEKDAERQRRKLLGQLEDGAIPNGGRQTLGEYLDWWVEHRQGRVRQSTADFYRRKVALVDKPARRVQLEKLAPEDVDDLLDRLAAKGLSPQTVAHVRSVVRNALNLQVKRRRLPVNVASFSEAPEVPRYEARTYTADQARALLAAVAGDRLESLYWVALTTGARKGETLGADWGHVDLEEGSWTPWFQPEWLKGGGFRLAPLKTKESRARLMLPPRTVDALKLRRREQLSERLEVGPAWQDHNLVWSTVIGTPVTPSNLHRHYHAACDRAGIPRLRWHDLRHTAPTLLLEAGVPLEVVSAMMRHTSITVTHDVYGHLGPSVLRQVADVMQQVLGG